MQAPTVLSIHNYYRLPGGEDRVFAAETDLRARFPALPRLEMETVPGAGHHLHLEVPLEVAARIRRAWDGL